MDKSGIIAKAIIAAPEMEPIKDVEYGCCRIIRCSASSSSNRLTAHLQEFMSENETVAEKLTNAYINCQATLSKPFEAQATKDPKDPRKSVPQTTLRSTYLCLQCSTVSSADDRDAHCQTRKHQMC
jgi:hypothetical protein